MSTLTPAQPEPFVSVEEVARVLGVPRSWVYEKSARGEIPCLKAGRYNRYRVSEVIEALERRGELGPGGRS
jgi:excisionase family DNA binding protein